MYQTAKTVTSKTLIISMFLTMSLIFVSAAVAAPWPGSGTEEDPYQIADANDLYALASNTSYYSGYFIVTADIDLAGWDGMDFIIAPDIDGSNEDYDGTVFSGTFDGNYHIIDNLTIDATGMDDDFLGLFGLIYGQVQNLGIENAVITGSSAPGGDTDYIGVLAGVNSGTIKYCYVTGQINDANSMNIGGLAGYNAGPIKDCYADVDVMVGVNSQSVGGFVGINSYASTINCYASGAVSGGSDVGGFAGIDDYFSESAIEDCYFLRLADGGGPDNAIASDLTDTEMQQQSSFINWDFFGEATNGTDEIWQMSGYPVLGWQVPVGMPELLLLAQHWLSENCIGDQPCSQANWYGDWSIDLIDFAMLQASWQQPMVETRPFPLYEDFETGDFTYLPWVHTGDPSQWYIVSDLDPNDVYEGSYAVKSGTIGDSAQTSIEFTADVTDYDRISFACKVSSQANGDILQFYIDDSPKNIGGWHGEIDWNVTDYGFSSGVHTFRWTYTKDISATDGDDCAWLDDITFIVIP